MINANVTEPMPETTAEERAADEKPPVDEETDRSDAHLDDVEVGAGCTEIWEHLADKRAQAAEDD